MTLDEAKELLQENNIPYEISKFENEAEYWRHVVLFPNTKYAKPCKVIALIIHSKNGKKNIELQFNERGGTFYFVDLQFGDFDFEMFDYNEDMLSDDLLNHINEIISGNFIVIAANDIKKRRWLGDACFDLNDDDFGKEDFQIAMQRIQKPKGFFSRLFRITTQYEIYDWNAYQCIVK